MNTKTTLRTLLSVALLGAFLCASACTDANLSGRDDGIRATEMKGGEVTPLYKAAVDAEVTRLRQADPTLSGKDALKQAMQKVDRNNYLVPGQDQDLKRQRKIEAQNRFEDKLEKTLKKN